MANSLMMKIRLTSMPRPNKTGKKTRHLINAFHATLMDEQLTLTLLKQNTSQFSSFYRKKAKEQEIKAVKNYTYTHLGVCRFH